MLIWEYLWGFVIIFAAGAEAVSLTTKGEPFTQFWRKWVIGKGQGRPVWLVWAGRIVTLGFCLWLGLHLGLGIA